MLMQTILDYELVRVVHRPVLDVVTERTVGTVAEPRMAEHAPPGVPLLTVESARTLADASDMRDDLVRLYCWEALRRLRTQADAGWVLLSAGLGGWDEARVDRIRLAAVGCAIPRHRIAVEVPAGLSPDRRTAARVCLHGFALAVRGPGIATDAARWSRLERDRAREPLCTWAERLRATGTEPILDGVRTGSELAEAEAAGIRLIAGPLLGMEDDVPRPVPPVLARGVARVVRRHPAARPSALGTSRPGRVSA